MAATSYNARQVVVTWGDLVLTDSAVETGEFCVVERVNPSTQMEDTMTGTVFAARNSRGGTVRVTLSSHGDANQALSDALAEQESSGRIIARKLMVKDYNGTEKAVSDKAVLEGYPSMSNAGDATVQSRTWTFLCSNLEMVLGPGTAL